MYKSGGNLHKTGIVELGSPNYPGILKTIKSPPKKLYFAGNYSFECFENAIAVVGTRRMSTYGKRVLESIFKSLDGDNLAVVSGFMYGIDTYAHKLAIEHNITTVGVLPCGPDVVHPVENAELYDKVLQSSGFFVSEFTFGSQPKIWTYPKRNRVIAGLCKATIIIEATLNSGSLITANFAKNFGRKVFAVPGDVTRSTSLGCLQLISDYAKPLVNPCDINKYLCCSSNNDSSYENIAIKTVLKKLAYKKMSISELSNITGLSVSNLNATVSELMLKGVVVERGGYYFAV